MVITTSNLVYYLLDRGLVTADSVVDGDFMVVDATRRNRNFKVIRQRDPSYFVKQIQNWDPEAIASLHREATCYRLSQNDGDFARLAPFLPKYRDFDSAWHVLVIELLREGENLTEYHRRLNKFPPEVAVELGRVLGTYHREVGAKLKDSPQSSVFPKRVPWILSVDQIGPNLFGTMSGANSQVVSIVQKYPEFQQSLQALRSQWQTNSLIHGDMKWDNCIVHARNGGGRELHLKLIDWELADFGDPCWDVGAIFQAYLSFWIFSMPANPEIPLTQIVERAQYPVDTMQPAIRAFWKAYVETHQDDEQTAARLLERSVKSGAARMIQTAYEYMYYSPQISANTLYMLQVSLNVLMNPEKAIGDLLGL